MRWVIIYLSVVYVIWCADDVGDDEHSIIQRIVRSLLFPFTLTSWFRSHNQRLHRLLTILWVLLVMGWGVSLLSDRLP